MAILASLYLALGLWSGSELNPHLYPSNTRSIVVIDFVAIRETGLFADQMAADFEEFLQDQEHFKRLNELLGVNLADATTMITICSSGSGGPPGPGGPGGDYLSISNGEFSFDQVSGVLAEMSERGELSTFTINELPVYFNHRSREAIYFTIVDDGIMIASSRKATIEDAIQGLTDLRPANQELLDRLKWSSEDTADVKEKPVLYLAGVFPEEARKQIENSPLKEIAKDMVGYNLTIHLSDKALFRGRLEMANTESCKRAEKMFNLFTGLMQTSMKNQGDRSDMLEFFSSLEIKADGSDLRFNLTAPKTLIAQISQRERTDPNSGRNRMRRAREERLQREAGESTGEASPAEESAPAAGTP